ncbi:MAG: DJ-1/PfpI family protein [Elainellaceae cyanobacterium]
MTRTLAILLFNDVEVLDFAGPFEVFSTTGQNEGQQPFQVCTVAETLEPILARNQLSINPQYTLDTCPHPDIVLVPGGGGYRETGEPYGTRREMDNPIILDWVTSRAQNTEVLLSVCTGALILAKAGLLDGLSATTHFQAMDNLRELAPHTQVLAGDRIVDNGHIILSAGISAGIDMALYVVAKLLSPSDAIKTATYMEYDWRHPLAVQT